MCAVIFSLLTKGTMQCSDCVHKAYVTEQCENSNYIILLAERDTCTLVISSVAIWYRTG